jgi:hypothetical protein
MEKESSLEGLKQKYNAFKDRYDLPLFGELNKDFQIEKAAESESDFVLREVRKYIVDKLSNYLRFVESLISPVNVPMFVFAITKTIGEREREKLREIYKRISKIEIEFIELDLEYAEEKEAEAIKRYSALWQEIKKELSDILGVIKSNWDAKADENGKGYFG